MADKTAPHSPEDSTKAFDLNSLSGLDFGPDWADGKSTQSTRSKDYESGGGGKGKDRRHSPNSSRDRRSAGRTHKSGGEHPGGRPGRGRPDSKPHSKPHFEPTVEVNLYPQDEAFDALVKRLRSSARTYQLFEIAHLLLEKQERYVVVVSPKKNSRNQEGASPLLYYSVPGHIPFETEEQAIDHVLKEHIDLFFEVEEVEVDPPSGNFQIINRCGITGELLGPPNYHRYQEFVQRHYATRISGMSLERFQSRITGSKEQEDISAWLESMKRGARYTVKDRNEGEPESLDTMEAARQFLIKHRKDKVVGSGESVRFAGRDIERIPRGNIRRSVEAYVEQQKHFPLDSANNIRGRLRRHKFAVYKKGSKGVSYVCAVKRKFRDSKTVFTDSIRDLIEFIEKHPEIPASKLSKEYIGIDTEKQKPDALVIKEQPESDTTDTKSEVVTPAEASVDPQYDVAVEKVEEKTPAEASTQATPIDALSDEEQKKLNQLMLDLRWLITEGYVTEYGDGRLFAPPPIQEANDKPKEKVEDLSAKPSEAEDDSSKPSSVASESESPS